MNSFITKKFQLPLTLYQLILKIYLRTFYLSLVVAHVYYHVGLSAIYSTSIFTHSSISDWVELVFYGFIVISCNTQRCLLCFPLQHPKRPQCFFLSANYIHPHTNPCTVVPNHLDHIVHISFSLRHLKPTTAPINTVVEISIALKLLL